MDSNGAVIGNVLNDSGYVFPVRVIGGKAVKFYLNDEGTDFDFSVEELWYTSSDCTGPPLLPHWMNSDVLKSGVVFGATTYSPGPEPEFITTVNSRLSTYHQPQNQADCDALYGGEIYPFVPGPPRGCCVTNWSCEGSFLAPATEDLG